MSSPACGGNGGVQSEATSIVGAIEPQRALHGPHELGDRAALEAQRRSVVGPCPQGDLVDTVLHEIPASRRRRGLTPGASRLVAGHVWLIVQGGITVSGFADRPTRAGCAARMTTSMGSVRSAPQGGDRIAGLRMARENRWALRSPKVGSRCGAEFRGNMKSGCHRPPCPAPRSSGPGRTRKPQGYRGSGIIARPMGRGML